MHNIKYFSKLDLKKGFYQIGIKKTDQHKTVFTTCIGKFEFKRILFGLLNSSKFFHNIMSEKLAGIKNIKIFMYDILVFTESREEHIEILKKLLNCLAEQNIEINFDKTEIMKEKNKYMGFEIFINKYKPDPERITTLNPWKKPKTRRQLQKCS
ncbi:Retrovirus-related Pol polyprotein from transposon gypsy [Dictyocoela muelleri]|nr:Retrovirus-related Pol polyprotein from transposon gypsy [Dictyocoela muelleri]